LPAVERLGVDLVVFAAVAFGADVFVPDAFVADAFVGVPDGLAGVDSDVPEASRAAAASARAVLLRAARALPAAVWAPFAFADFPAAMRALAALAAAALPVCFVTRPPAETEDPPRAALTFNVSRDFRRAAAFGWIAPTLAARSSAESASMRAVVVVSASAVAAVVNAFATCVFAALRRGASTSRRRLVCRTRLRPDGERAPDQVRGVLAKGNLTDGTFEWLIICHGAR
jgi:hypothetical protein